jgi:DNA-binding CsgD family transcriptional regulator
VAQIYDAALDVDRWEDALATLAGLFQGPKAQISYYASPQDASPFFKFWGFSEGEIARTLTLYRQFALVDPRWPPRMFKAYHCRQIVSDESLRSSELYRQALAPARVEYSLYFGLEFPDEGLCGMGIMRGPDQGAFTAEDCDDFGRFIPHVSRAVGVHEALRRARGTIEAAQALIDGVPLGMVVLQDDKIVLANSAARALLDRGEPLRSSAGRLLASTSSAEARFRQVMREALGSRDQANGAPLLTGGGEKVWVVARRLQPSTAGLLGAREGAIALYISDPHRPLETSREVLRRLFGLTDREATVLHTLLQGHDTRAIAGRLAIGTETVKTHLRHVMQSVGVRRQTELIKLVLSSPAWLSGQGAED